MGWSPATIDSIGARQLGYQTSLLKTIEWWKLLPDTSHRLVTRGYGTCPTAGSIVAVTCVTDAYSSSRRLALIYEPTGATITVDMSRMARPTKARWYDPTSGKYTSVSSRVLANSGTRTFTPPAANGAGDHDWVLLLQAAPTR
jgi:hypothetical protein